MNTKVIAIVAVVAVLVVAVAGAVVMMTGDDDGNFTGVIYDGNGGKTANGSTTWNLTSDVVYKNPFTYEGYTFVNWNTKADGSGTAYNVGDSISYPEHGNVKLYAQWTVDSSMKITSFNYSHTISTGDSALQDGVSLYIGDTKLSSLTAYFATLSDNTIVAIQAIDGCTDWAYDTENGYFTFNYNGHEYTLAIAVTNSENALGFFSNDVPCFGFQPQGNVSMTAALKYVHN